jgi:nucleobase:cation symporter-1, NCS1 family
VLNIYSGAMSFVALGIRLPLAARRAIVALAFGTVGFFLAWSGLSSAASKYNNFLLIIAYWIAPWLAVSFSEQFLRWRLRRGSGADVLFDTSYENWAGPVAMLVGMGVSIWLFSNQTEYVGVVPSRIGSAGDITFEAGFLITGLIYISWRVLNGRADIP